MFKYSTKDVYLIFLAVLQVISWIIPVIYFDQLTVFQVFLFGLANFCLMATNYECIAHNFMHNPFFKWKPLNKLFSITNSIAMGMPQAIYNSEHINHHLYTNDKWNENTPPQDNSSTYYNGKSNQEESAFRYTFLAYFRISLFEQAKGATKYSGKLVYVELLAITVFFGWLLITNPFAFLVFVLPTHYFGTCVAALENYVEHYACDPENPKANSVSVYNKFYNLIWFNNGYHQEHHCNPKVHWVKIPSMRKEMLPEDQRRVVKGMHLINLFTKVEEKTNQTESGRI